MHAEARTNADLSEPILRALAAGPKAGKELRAELGVSDARFLYYAEPLVWRHRLVTVIKEKGANVWALRLPLEDALSALRTPKPPQVEAAPVVEVIVAVPVAVPVVEATPVVSAPAPAPAPTPEPLTREQLARRLELIRNRHHALSDQGKIKGGRRCSA